jgi:hypothetical protein
MIFLLLACVTQAELVDDFESYELGAIGTVTTIWTGSGDGGAASTASIVTDPTDADNKVIQLTEGGGQQQWVRAELSPGATIANNTTGTLFLRFKATAAIDSSFGLTDLDTASNDWNHFRVQVAVVNGSIRARDGGSTRTLAYASAPATQVAINTDWYYLWVVVDNAADTIKLYLNQTGADATEADRLVTLNNASQNTFGFRLAGDSLDRFFWRAQGNPTSRMLMLDDLNITQGTNLSIPSSLKPYGPSVEQVSTETGVDVTLKWKAGKDPAGVYAVNPEIADQYVFMGEAAGTLFYKGSTGDPGTDTPDSQFLTTAAYDKTYSWVVVEALDGYQQTLTPNVSTLSAVDPNNIIGSTWTFTSLVSSPVISVHPAETRVFAADADAVITCTFTSVSTPTVEWYKSDSATPLADGGDIVITLTNTGTTYTAQLQILTPTDADQGSYYCTVDNGTMVTSDAATLVINKLLAHYKFDGTLTDSSTNGAPAGQGKSLEGLTEPNSLQSANVALEFVTGLNGVGQAVYLDPNEYIDFGVNGYPRASSLAGQIGGGLDACTILCWVKPNAADHRQGIVANYNLDITTGVGFSLESNMDIRINVRGEATEILTAQGRSNRPEYNLFDGWHLIGVSWDARGASSALYVDGQWVANDTTMGLPAAYANWQRGVLVGAGRQGSPNRHLLTDLFSGAIDELRIYNYRLTSEQIADEYYAATGVQPCTNMTFAGSNRNFNNTGTSYCIVDIADMADMAASWLASGLLTAN